MSKKRKFIDPRQGELDLSGERIQVYCRLKEEILETPDHSAADPHGRWEEDCMEIATALKRAIRASDLSREDVADKINEHYGWPTAEAVKKEREKAEKIGRKPPSYGLTKEHKHLSYEMFDHYLSKPAAYLIPAFLLYAFQRITKTLDPARSLAEDRQADVISPEERRELALGKLEKTLDEMHRWKKELKGKLRGR